MVPNREAGDRSPRSCWAVGSSGSTDAGVDAEFGGWVVPADDDDCTELLDMGDGSGGSWFVAGITSSPSSGFGTIIKRLRNSWAELFVTNASFPWFPPFLPPIWSVLFPTTTTQKFASSPSWMGTLVRNSSHQRCSSCSELGLLTSKTRITASAPRKNAAERDENRSCPAVSQICSVVGS